MRVDTAIGSDSALKEGEYRVKTLLRIVGFIALAVCLASQIAIAQTHQGRWAGVARVDTPGCGADVTIDGEVRGNQFRGQGAFPGAAPGFEWAVTADGGVYGSGMQGRISANRLSGTWQKLILGRMCSYRIELTRR
jgi:hypothetical protein